MQHTGDTTFVNRKGNISLLEAKNSDKERQARTAGRIGDYQGAGENRSKERWWKIYDRKYISVEMAVGKMVFIKTM